MAAVGGFREAVLFANTVIVLTLVFLPSASALLSSSESKLVNPQPFCDNSGNLRIEVQLNDRPLPVGAIEISAKHEASGSKISLIGTWFVNDQAVTVIPAKPGKSTFVSFRSNKSGLSKAGLWLVELSYFATAADHWPTKIYAKVDCPGKACSSDNQCGEDEFCAAGHCEALLCGPCQRISFNRCVFACSDDNPCTKERCTPTGCTSEPIAGCCRRDADCDDGLVCTSDSCINNSCSHSQLSCAASVDRCVYGRCLEEVGGCAYELNKSCLANESEKRRYLIVVGSPKVIKPPLGTRIVSWLKAFIENFFG